MDYHNQTNMDTGFSWWCDAVLRWLRLLRARLGASMIPTWTDDAEGTYDAYLQMVNDPDSMPAI